MPGPDHNPTPARLLGEMPDARAARDGRTRPRNHLPIGEYYTNMRIAPTMQPIIDDARAKIHSRHDVRMRIRQSGYSLYLHELAKRKSPDEALRAVMLWLDDQCRIEAKRRLEPTPLEKRLLQMLVQDGMTMKQIAFKTGRNLGTTKANFKRIRKRLGDITLYQLVALSVERGWVRVRLVDKE
jgi:DNA-binding CsgD family transcriptional regulator